MRCLVCGKEKESEFCENCGWEDENILDDSYLDRYNKKLEIYKRVYNRHNKFLDKLIEKFNPLLKENKFEELNTFIDLVIDLLEEDKFIIEFRLAKIYALLKLNRKEESKKVLNELEKYKSSFDNEQRSYFENFKKVLDV